MLCLGETLQNQNLKDYRREAAKRQLVPKGATRLRIAALLYQAASAIGTELVEHTLNDGNSPCARHLI